MSKRTLKRAGPTFPATVVTELQKIEAELGGRDAIVGLLTLAPLTQDLRYLLGLLGDPLWAGKSLAELCAAGNILPGELLKQLSQAAMLRGKVLASQSIGNGIAAVTQDVMRRAAPFEEACSGCQGTGSITPNPTPQVPNPTHAPCETCRGTGRLIYLPDLERQKLAIEMAQLLPKGGGLQILNANVQGAAGGAAGLGPIEKLQALTDKILYGTGGRPSLDDGPPDTDIVEGETTPLEEEHP